MIEPCASSTARETMFSEAISSIWSWSRFSSLAMAEAISGSLSASEAVKKLLESGRLRSTSETDMVTPLLTHGCVDPVDARKIHAVRPKRSLITTDRGRQGEGALDMARSGAIICGDSRVLGQGGNGRVPPHLRH